jgi:RNA polymerase-binding transcription factor
MTNAELNNVKAALEAKRLEIMAQLRGRTRELRIDSGQSDPIDLMKGMSDRDETAGMLDRYSSTLADVERALRALRGDTYGICAECEEPIAPKRLKSIPWAACCVRCQEALEAGEERESRPRFDSMRAA